MSTNRETYVVRVIDHSPLIYKNKGSIITLMDNVWIKFIVSIAGKEHTVTFKFQPGYKCDGLSVPKLFRWFLINWDDTNELYNLAGMVHDALYGRKGFCIFTRDECDAIFRGLLRESGKDRKHASMADWAVGMFASGHWGDDSLHSASLTSMELK